MKLWLLISMPLYLLDQLTKMLILRHVSPDEIVPVIPGFFNLVQVHNTGAAFGMLKDNNLFFVVLSFAALITLVILERKGAFADWTSRWAAALLVAGVAGNLTDRHSAWSRGRFSGLYSALVRPMARVQCCRFVYLCRRGIVHPRLIAG